MFSFEVGELAERITGQAEYNFISLWVIKGDKKENHKRYQIDVAFMLPEPIISVTCAKYIKEKSTYQIESGELGYLLKRSWDPLVLKAVEIGKAWVSLPFKQMDEEEKRCLIALQEIPELYYPAKEMCKLNRYPEELGKRLLAIYSDFTPSKKDEKDEAR